MEHFGEKLRRLRGDRPQKHVAEALRIPQTTLSSLEKQRSIPRGDLLKKLADFYAVSIDYFYTTPELNSSEGARVWLQQLRTESKGRETIAMHGPLQFDSKTREQIAKKLRQKYGEVSRDNR